MRTLQESKELLLARIKSKAYRYILMTGSESIDSCLPLRRLMEIYVLISALPVSSPIIEWYRKSPDKVRIELIEDVVRIYKVESQQVEQLDFVEGDICTLVCRALECKN